jgi:hypothetical protein
MDKKNIEPSSANEKVDAFAAVVIIAVVVMGVVYWLYNMPS